MSSASETYLRAERLLGVFFRLTQLTNEETPDEVVAQLNVNQLRALNLIYREPGISQKALAERLDISSAAVSVSIGKLLEAELVERHHDADDGRIMNLYLGSRGKELVRKVEDGQIQVIAELLDGLPADEQARVVETLERALRIWEQKSEIPLLSGV
ncbi:MAG: MarR family transcriptional regulator [Anaerolineae bacterium]